MQNQTVGNWMFPKGNAITMLADDHERVRRLLGEFARCRDQNETALCQQLSDLVCTELDIHFKLKQEIFYPAARQVVDHPLMLDKSEIEQEMLQALVDRVRQGKPGDPKYYASVAVLGQFLRHHTDDEERELFWLMRKSGTDLEALGARMAARRAELGGQAGLAHPDSAEALPA